MDNAAFISYAKVKTKKIEWLWFPYIAYGKITILEGDPGEGKTSIALFLASMFSKGGLGISDSELEPINIVYQSAEDNPEDSIKPKLIAYKSKCENVYFIKSSKKLSVDCDEIDKIVKEKSIRLFVLDPIQAFIGDNNISNINGLRNTLNKIADVADKYKCAVLLIGHMNKTSMNKDLYRSLGSIDIVALARSVLMLKKPADYSPYRIMYQIKNNLAALGKPIGFEFNNKGMINYLGEINPEDYDTSSSKIDKACLFLHSILFDGPISYKEIMPLIENMDISVRTLNEAKKRIGVRAIKKKDGWYWSLSEESYEQR